MILQSEDNKTIVSFPDGVVYLKLVKDLYRYIVKGVTATGEIPLCSFNDEDSGIKCIQNLIDSYFDGQDIYRFSEYIKKETNSKKKPSLTEIQSKLDLSIQQMVGNFYKHFKGSTVRVQFISVDATSDSEDFLITYKHEDSEVLWTRKLSDFTAKLTIDQVRKYGQSNRFVKHKFVTHN